MVISSSQEKKNFEIDCLLPEFVRSSPYPVLVGVANFGIKPIQNHKPSTRTTYPTCLHDASKALMVFRHVARGEAVREAVLLASDVGACRRHELSNYSTGREHRKGLCQS